MTAAQSDKVSVLVPLYNCGPYIVQCLESICGQTYSNLEILVSDDASTDDSADRVRELAARDSRITFFAQERNLGLLDNYNFLLRKATGAFIAIQDSDDWSEPDRIEKQLRAMAAHPGVVLVGCNIFFHYPGRDGQAEQQDDVLINGIHDYFISAPASVLFRRSLLEKSAQWHPYFNGGTSMDRYFLMEILEGETAFHLGKPLYHARVLGTSNHRSFNERKIVTGLIFNELLAQRRATGTDWLKENDFDSIRKREREILADRGIMAQRYREYAVYQIDTDNLPAGLDYLKKAFTMKPLSLMNLRTAVYYLRRKFTH